MPLPADMQARLSDPRFWRAYVFEDDDPGGDDDLDDDDSGGDAESTAEDGDDVMAVEFPVGGGYALVLDIDVELHMVTLEMRSPSHPDTLQLGWDDEAHWHPHALRWAELDLIARAAAVLDPALRHPGPVVALAARFVVLAPEQSPAVPEQSPAVPGADGDPLDAITPLLDAAFGPPPPGADHWPTARDLVHRIDARRDGVTWRREGTGDWTVTQDGDGVDFALYSVRHPGGEFPFADWRALLDAAEATLRTGTPPAPLTPVEEAWTAETRTGAPPGSLIAARFGPSPLRDSRRFRLGLRLPVEGRPHSWAVALREDLDRSLRDAGRGWAEPGGSTMTLDGATIEERVEIAVLDDLDAGVAVIRAALHRHDAAPTTRIVRAGEPIGTESA